MTFKIRLKRKLRQQPYWHKVLSFFEKKGYILNGLTVPFLIGMRQIVEPDQPLLTIRQLIAELSSVGGVISKCDRIGEYVIGTIDPETERYLSHYTKAGNLIILDDIFGSEPTVDQIVNACELLCAKPIHAGCFSKEAGEWVPFSSQEIIQIEQGSNS